MKKTSKKLTLQRTVVRMLSERDLANAGGGITGTCTQMCSNTTACHCFPKTMYPTD